MSNYNFSKYDGNAYGGGDAYIKDTENRKYPSVSLIYDVVKPSINSLQQNDFNPQMSSFEDVLDWKCCKTMKNDGVTPIVEEETDVTIPHTFNVADCKSYSCWSGYAEYRRDFDLDEDKDHYLTIYQMAQRGNVLVDGEVVKKHISGFLPCTVKIPSGKHKITVETNNLGKNSKYIPYSADYAFVNGLVGKAKIQHFSGAYIDPISFGYQRCHITTLDCNSTEAKINVKTKILSQDSLAKNINLNLRIDIKDVDGLSVFHKDIPFIITESEHLIDVDFSFANPVLWNGKENPYLYNVVLTLYYNSTKIDEETIKYGVRRFDYPIRKNRPCRLNGNEIILRGVCMHQDSDERSVALLEEDYIKESELLQELGCNYVRIAHYPHNVFRFDELDRLGILCQTEVPWVNWYGNSTAEGVLSTDVPIEYDECIKEYAHEMVNQLYNHPSIVFWGLCNEVGNDGSFIKNTTLTYRFAELVNSCVEDLHCFGPRVYVGLTQNTQVCHVGLSCDWMTYNIYPKWYDGNIPDEDYAKDDVTVASNSAASSYNYLFNGVGEYGYGADPFYHGEDYLTGNISNGKFQPSSNKHYEEYATLCHIKAWNNIVNKSAPKDNVYGSEGVNTFKTMTTIWIFKDFAVPARNEGGEQGINDKGLMSRNWSIKKDTFYMYKSLWNEEPLIYICEKRWNKRASESFRLRVFSNTNQPVSLYKITENGEVLVETKDTPTLPNCNLYEFEGVTFDNYVSKQISLVVKSGDISDSATFITTAALTANMLSLSSNEISALHNADLEQTLNIVSDGGWKVENVPDWLALTATEGEGNGTISFTFDENTSETTRSTTLIFTSLSHNDVTFELNVLQYGASSRTILNAIKCTSNNGYFKTDYLVNQDSYIETKFGNCLSFTNTKPFGINELNKKCYIFTSSNKDFNAEFGNATIKVGSTNSKITIPSTTSSDTIFKIGKENVQVEIGDATQTFNYTTSVNDFTSTIPMYIGLRNDASDNMRNLILYYFKIYENGRLIHDFVPANVDNVICLVDRITNETIKPTSGTWVEV